MKSKLLSFLCFSSVGLIVSIGCLLPQARAQSQVIMGIDGMNVQHHGLFRIGGPQDGFNTLQFGPIQFPTGSLGQYRSFNFVASGPGWAGIQFYGRVRSDSPESSDGFSDYPPVTPVTPSLYPVLDRAAFGALFDPNQYQIEVKFKPNSGPSPIQNQADSFNVVLEQIDGFMNDAEENKLKRANEFLTYSIGSAATPINTWYASAPKDANGFATWTVPVIAPTSAFKGFYYDFGNGTFRTDHVVTGGGRVFNPSTSQYEDVIDGPDFNAFGGPGSPLKVPNGLGELSLQRSLTDQSSNLSIEVRSVLVKKTQSDSNIVMRLDENSGVTHRFGTALAYDVNNPPPPASAIIVGGTPYKPIATD